MHIYEYLCIFMRTGVHSGRLVVHMEEGFASTWGVLSSTRGAFASTWAVFVDFDVYLCIYIYILMRIGVHLGVPCRPLGGVFASTWGALASTWGVLSSTWGAFASTWGVFMDFVYVFA